MKEYHDFLKRCTNTRKYQLETVEEFLKKPMLYVPKKYVENLEELSKCLPEHKCFDEQKKNSAVFAFETLEDRDQAKTVLEEMGIHYTSGKTLVPFRLSGNVEWGVPFPDCEDLKGADFLGVAGILMGAGFLYQGVSQTERQGRGMAEMVGG